MTSTDALVRAQKDLGDATASLREAEVMAKLEPVTKDQYLIEPGTFAKVNS